MWQVGIWEPEAKLSPLLSHITRTLPCLLRASSAPHPTWAVPLDLLVVAPHTPIPATLPTCTAALLPGDVPPPAFLSPPKTVVSYGCASCHTLTLSSLTAARTAVAVQRSFPRLDGSMVEEQELILPGSGSSPLTYLAFVGTALLLGYLPEPWILPSPGLYALETM